MPASRPRLLLPLLAGVLLVALILVVVIGGGSSGSPPGKTFTASSSPFEGAALPRGQRAPEFTLTDQNGREVSLAQFRGGVTVLTFLYSTCGAPCVVIAQQIRGALNELPKPVPVLIVSVSPRGDTPANIRRFLAQVSLTGRVHYLRGSPARLKAVWKAYKVVPASAGRSAFAEYASVLLIDGKDDQRVLFQSEQLTPEALSHDIRKLEKGSRASEGLIP
jgi:protein SCO1